MTTLSVRLSLIIAPMNSSSATAMVTVSHTGGHAARKKPAIVKRMSLTELMTLSP